MKVDVLSRSARILAAATVVRPVQMENTAPTVKPLVALLYVERSRQAVEVPGVTSFSYE